MAVVGFSPAAFYNGEVTFPAVLPPERSVWRAATGRAVATKPAAVPARHRSARLAVLAAV
ncbi:hypothetical protein ACG97_09015 [Vogesella sp. EB]|nr:hypothetical protein ACG97_09015 [Vogesella sp. EB]